jgi:hypothetical protein
VADSARCKGTLHYPGGTVIGQTCAFQPAAAALEPRKDQPTKETEMARRYKILERVPTVLAFVDDQLQEASGCRAGSREREQAIIAAAETAYNTTVGLTQAAPLWMALQRQVLVKGWRFEDLEQLDQLTVPATVELLVALRVGRQQQAETLLREAIATETAPAEDFIEAACAKLEEVKRAAEQAAAADGLTAPSAELLLVDHAHTEVMKVRRELAALLDAWTAEQDHEVDVQHREARLQTILKRCGTAVGVIAFLTAAALQIPEVQREVVHAASELAQVIQHMAEAIRAQVGALGVIAATGIASKPGEGFSLIEDSGPSPNGPSPSRDPDSAAVSIDSTPRSDLPTEQGEPPASRSPEPSIELPYQDDELVGSSEAEAHSRSMGGPEPAEKKALPPGFVEEELVPFNRHGVAYRELGSDESQQERRSRGAPPAH